MEPIRLEDILGRERYGTRRGDVRRRIIEHKLRRRVAVGDRLTFLFEDRATVWYQTQEMLWVEHIDDLDGIRGELAVYNESLPGPAELSATLFVEIEDQARIAEELRRLIGIDECVTLEVGSRPGIRGRFAEGRQTEEKLSAVQYVRFPLDPDARAAAIAGAPLALRVEHPAYRARTIVTEPVRTSLIADLADPAAADAALRRVRDGD
ncbi:MAG TPA: DUF3501 family protein [Candidatus Binatia bacterium]|nr:DUF3501 family protein [Candidatus Binatia bacterium]